MKTIFFIILTSIISTSYAQNMKSATSLTQHSKDNKYQFHKKQLMEQELNNAKDINKKSSDDNKEIKNDNEVVDFSTGKPIKIK